MAKDRRSFFERLTGAVSLPDDMEEETYEETKPATDWMNNTPEEGELSIDVYQTMNEIIIKTMVAGVKPEDLDVLITRDSVTLHGKRSEDRTISDDEYFHRELYWGSFARVIALPEEVDVDAAEAVEKYGMLILHLPKIDKNRQTKLKVKGN